MRGGLFTGWTDHHFTNRPDYLVDVKGAELFVQVAPKMGFLQEVVFLDYDYDDDRWSDVQLYKSTITYIISKNAYFALNYTHKFQETNNRQNYRENLFTLSWVYKL